MRQNISRHTRLGLQAVIFLLATCFALSAGATEYVIIKKNGVNIRSGPSQADEILWEAFENFPVKILQKVVKKDGQWAQIVDFENDKGWVFSQLTEKKKMVIVKVDAANLRIGPGQNYEPIATVKYGVVFKPLARESDWIKVEHKDGTVGWIFKDLLWPND